MHIKRLNVFPAQLAMVSALCLVIALPAQAQLRKPIPKPVTKKPPTKKAAPSKTAPSKAAPATIVVKIAAQRVTSSRVDTSSYFVYAVSAPTSALKLPKAIVKITRSATGKPPYVVTVEASRIVSVTQSATREKRYRITAAKTGQTFDVNPRDVVSMKRITKTSPPKISPPKTTPPKTTPSKTGTKPGTKPGTTTTKPKPPSKTIDIRTAPIHKLTARQMKSRIAIQTPVITGYTRSLKTITPGGRPMLVKLKGQHLDRLSKAVVVVGKRLDNRFKVEISTPIRGARTVSIMASPSVPAGAAALRFYAGRTMLRASVPLQITRNSIVAAKVLPFMAADARVIKPKVNIRKPGQRPTKIGKKGPAPEPTYTPLTMYDVYESSASKRWSGSVKEAAQKFIATGTRVTSLSVKLSGSGSVRARIYEAKNDAPLLGDKTTTINSNGMTYFGFPDFDVTPGKRYWVHLTKSYGTFTINATTNHDKYIFSGMTAKTGDDWTNHQDKDMVMRVSGSYKNMPESVRNPQRPTKKALLILLENGGITLEQVGPIANLVPDITIARCGTRELELSGNETLLGKFGDLLATLGHCANPFNWTFETLTFEDWWQPTSDRILEDISNAISEAVNKNTPQKYDHVVKLEDEQFTATNILSTLEQLSTEYVVDIHVLSHGTTDYFIGYDHEYIGIDNFFAKLHVKKATGQIPLHLRSVYQMNCSSGTLVNKWRAVGAQVVNGTQGDKLNCMPTQYHHFLDKWLRNNRFNTSISQSYDLARPFWSAVWIMDPVKVTDSRHYVHGDSEIRMSSP